MCFDLYLQAQLSAIQYDAERSSSGHIGEPGPDKFLHFRFADPEKWTAYVDQCVKRLPKLEEQLTAAKLEREQALADNREFLDCWLPENENAYSL